MQPAKLLVFLPPEVEDPAAGDRAAAGPSVSKTRLGISFSRPTVCAASWSTDVPTSTSVVVRFTTRPDSTFILP